ncbi:MAG: SAM-dependent chlorinase/fluorinase [Acidobacteriaceae bacterium]|jgi:S-adenosylmethionine hydrolase|nr:SAM-dependent chlorinase/fluorinase [Acidobacteriaceae bacterium]
MTRPVIALITDFGLQNHYVGVMKGVMLGICPDATCVDITHDIPPQDTLTAALELEAAVRYFPAGTIFLVVVDPGVGSSRRALAIEAGDRRFVGPDNGVFTTVIRDAAAHHAVELTESRYWRFTVSRTFEGRDRFAPVAAWMATGVGLGSLGTAAGALTLLQIPAARATDDGLSGDVLCVDRFGNLVTNIDRWQLESLGEVSVQIGAQHISQVSGTYADVEEGAWLALIGSSDRLEISVRGGNASALLPAGRGARVRVLKRA